VRRQINGWTTLGGILGGCGGHFRDGGSFGLHGFRAVRPLSWRSVAAREL